MREWALLPDVAPLHALCGASAPPPPPPSAAAAAAAAPSASTAFLEENVLRCLAAFRDSEPDMFGCHEKAAAIGITGDISLVEIDGPVVVLGLRHIYLCKTRHHRLCISYGWRGGAAKRSRAQRGQTRQRSFCTAFRGHEGAYDRLLRWAFATKRRREPTLPR